MNKNMLLVLMLIYGILLVNNISMLLAPSSVISIDREPIKYWNTTSMVLFNPINDSDLPEIDFGNATTYWRYYDENGNILFQFPDE